MADFVVHCSEHPSTELAAEFKAVATRHGWEPVLQVEPCEDCLEAAREDVRKEADRG